MMRCVMKLLRFSWRSLLLISWVFIGLATLLLVFPWAKQSWRQRIIQWWSDCLLRFCGVRVSYSGIVVKAKPVLFVSNHVSWLDIFVINKQRATSFVAKKEIRNWPVLGWLVAWAGTVFIDRTQRHAIKQVVIQVQEKLERNQAVGLFPEGKTSNGLQVQPFHSSLFETAIRTQMDVQPVALRFYHGTQRCTVVAFVGEQSIVQNVWLLLTRPGVHIECEFLNVLSHNENQSQGRIATAKQAQQLIEKAVLKGL